MRVCIIGAGAAGLCAARHSLRLKNLKKIVVYEQTEHIGGTTNLPKEVMAFPDFPFEKNTESFLGHRGVKQYLINYATHYSVDRYIKFRQKVLHVRNISNQDSKEIWQVQSENLLSKEPNTAEFDCVFICNGHYSEPVIPEIEGRESFKGKILHSHDYRSPEGFSGQKIACLGAGASGVDIAVELAEYCSHVYLCHDLDPLETYLFPNMTQKPGFLRFTENGVTLKNGEELDLDSVIFCTGYHYCFPFLDRKELPLAVEQGRITPLYQHLVHVEQPSLFFVGLCTHICPFPNFDVQIQFCVSVLNGHCQLPSKRAMHEWEEEDYRKRTEAPHYLGGFQWEYNQSLSALGNFPCPVAPVVEKLYNQVHKERTKNVTNYKALAFQLLSDTEFSTVSE